MYWVTGFHWDNGYEQEVERSFETLDAAEHCLGYYDCCCLTLTDDDGNVLKERDAG